MILHSIYSVNLWLGAQLSTSAPVAFTEHDELRLPGYRVEWGSEREARVSPRGVLSGARFTVYCVASRSEAHVSRRLATVLIGVLRRAERSGFTIPRYRYPRQETDEPVDHIAVRDVSDRPVHLPDHPELAVHAVQATAIALNPPVS